MVHRGLHSSPGTCLLTVDLARSAAGLFLLAAAVDGKPCLFGLPAVAATATEGGGTLLPLVLTPELTPPGAPDAAETLMDDRSQPSLFLGKHNLY